MYTCLAVEPCRFSFSSLLYLDIWERDALDYFGLLLCDKGIMARERCRKCLRNELVMPHSINLVACSEEPRMNRVAIPMVAVFMMLIK